MAGEDTHVTGLGGNVNLNAAQLSVMGRAGDAGLGGQELRRGFGAGIHIVGLEDGLMTPMWSAYIVLRITMARGRSAHAEEWPGRMRTW